MKMREKLLLSFLLIGVLGGLAGLGTLAAFSSTTSDSNLSFDSGTVSIADNDANSALYNLSNRKPGDSVSSCVKVTYTGSLPADVHLYTTSTVGSLGQYIDLTITPGTQAVSSFPSCTGFVADLGGAIYSGTLQSFANTKNSYANGVVDYPGTVATSWTQNDSVVYQFTVTLQSGAPDSAQGLSTGSHGFTWEARNQ
jgi:predicted ribosomally synthesized peptide with SipW-like signal peptide